jgi:hypothetical protein
MRTARRSLTIEAALLVALLGLAALPEEAFAQSAFIGVVRDKTGAVLPGVTVEAESPVLIERVRSATTNEQGQYRILDLRPGVYTLSFTLVGFKTVKLTGIELKSDFTATVNAELELGNLEESVVVTGESPMVDVSSIAQAQVLTREVLDAVPTGRTLQGLGQLIVGVTLNQPDVGGSRAMQQTYMATRGLTSANNIVQVDGLMINGLDGDGAVQQYINNAMAEEMVYQTGGAGADVSQGGVRINIVPKDGGNRFSGSFFGSWSDGAWQSDNFTDELRQRGLRAVDKIDRIYDFNFAQGGPIKRDRLWFFTSARAWSVNAPIADTFYPDGRQGIDDQRIKSALLRLTWQISPRHKFSAYYDEIDKYRGHGMNAGDDPLTASQVWTSPIYNDGAAKWTATLSDRLLVETGFSFNYEEYVIKNQPGVVKERGTPEWYAGASRNDIDRGTRWSGLATWGGRYPDRYNLQSSMSYVTGAHSIKAGFQWTWGPYENTRDASNADLQQQYRSGRPSQVVIYNTPLRYQDRLNADIGLYAQDSWALKRLTLNYGVRWEYLNHEVSEGRSGAGRFVGERSFPRIPMPTWKDWAPRFGLIYDLFGNAKTAVKFGINRYNETRTTGFANQYNPLGLTSATLSWTDLDGDDIADGELGCVYLTPGCEINFAQMPRNFGTLALNRVDPNFKRTYNIETLAGIQHELLPRVSLSSTWYRRTFHRLRVTDNLLITMDDYTPIPVVNPMTGEVFNLYTRKPDKLGLVDNFDTNAGPGRKLIYSGVDLTFNARLIGGATLFGGLITERTLRVTCDEPDNPNLLRFCDDRDNGIPWRTSFKFAGTYPLPWGIQVSASFQSLAGRPLGGFSTAGNRISGPGYGDTGSPLGPQWNISRTTRYPADCKGPCTPGALVAPGLTEASVTVPLVPPGTVFYPRLNQLDLSFAKWFQVGRVRWQGQVDLFNALNASTVVAVRSVNFGTPAYNQPSSVLQGRIVRLATQLRW